VNFVSPLVVSATQNNALDLEFDLGHPAFIVGHVPPGSGTTLWAVNFDGPVRHHPLHDLSRPWCCVICTAAFHPSPDNTSISISRSFRRSLPFRPKQPWLRRSRCKSWRMPTNGTLLYDVDGQTPQRHRPASPARAVS
jgi:hypothetical protein